MAALPNSDGLNGLRRRLARVVRAFVKSCGSVERAKDRLGVAHSTFYLWKGSRAGGAAITVPPAKELKRIAKATGVSLDWLFFARDGEPVRYRDSTRSEGELAADLASELTRRLVDRTGLTGAFIEDYLQRHAIDDIVDEMAVTLAERVMNDADLVRTERRGRDEDLLQSLIHQNKSPQEQLEWIRQRLATVAPSPAELSENERRREELLRRPSPDESVPQELGSRVRVSPPSAIVDEDRSPAEQLERIRRRLAD